MGELPQFEQRLRRFSRVRRGLLNAALGYRLGLAALAAAGAALLLLAGWVPNPFVNLAVALLAGLALLALAVTYLWRRVGFRSPLDEAFRAEALAGGLNSRLISALDFLAAGPTNALTDRVIVRAGADLATAFEARLDRHGRDHARRRFLAASLVVLVLAFLPWCGVERAWGTLRHSWYAALETLWPLECTLDPPPGRYVRRLGAAFELRIKLGREGLTQLALDVTRDGKTRAVTLLVDTAGRASYRLDGSEEAEYQLVVRVGDRASAPVTVIFTTPPRLMNMQTEMIFPAYTRLLPRPLEGVQQRLSGLPGTRLTLGFTFSKDLRAATLTWDDGEKLPLDTLARFASIALVHQRARQASLQVEDIHGLPLDEPLVMDFELLADEKPRLFLPRHLKEDMPLLAEGAKLFGFGVRAEDDYGITRCTLNWQQSTVDNPTKVVNQGQVERVLSPVGRKGMFSFEKIFESLPLQPGDKISFQLEVLDNRTPDPQKALSPRFSFFVYQEGLGGLTIKELGFGDLALGRGRLPKARRATSVKEPEGLRVKEQVRNEFQAAVDSQARAPTVRGPYREAVQDYFRLLSTVSYKDEKEPDHAPKD